MKQCEKRGMHGDDMMYLLFTIGKKIRELTRRHAALYGINANELETILFLAKGDQDTSRDLVCNHGFSRSLVSKTVDSLLKNGYIKAEQDAEDRRVMHLILLPKAQSIVDEMEAMREEMRQKSLEGVTEQETAEVVRVFHKIKKNVEALITEELRESE